MKKLITILILLVNISINGQTFKLDNQKVLSENRTDKILQSTTTQGGVLIVDEPNKVLVVRENRKFGNGFDQYIYYIQDKEEGDGDIIYKAIQGNGASVEVVIYNDKFQVLDDRFTVEIKFL